MRKEVILTPMKHVSLCNDQCQTGWLSECLYFLRHCKYETNQTLHEGSTYRALPIHTAFSDLDCISRSQQC